MCKLRLRVEERDGKRKRRVKRIRRRRREIRRIGTIRKLWRRVIGRRRIEKKKEEEN